MIKIYRFTTVCLLLLSAALFINLHSDIYVPENKPFFEFPTKYKDWRMVSESVFSQEILNVLKPTAYMFREYVSDSGVPVYLYIGYHGGGNGSGEIHSPKHCLPGGGWFKSFEQEIVFDTGNKKINVVKACYSMGEEKRYVFLLLPGKGKIADE